MRKERLSEKEIIKVLMWHVDNGSIQARTAKKFKLSTATVRTWLKSHPEIINRDRSQAVIAQIEFAQTEAKLSFTKKYCKHAEEIIDLVAERMKQIIPNIKDPHALIKIAETFNPNAIKIGENETGDDNLRIKVDEQIKRANEAWERILKLNNPGDIEDAEYEHIKQ